MTSSIRRLLRTRRPAIGAAILVLLTAGLMACSGDPYPQSSLHPTSDSSRAIDGLFRQIVWWAVAVFVVVQAVLVYTLIKFRRQPDSPAPKAIHGNTVVEIAWTLAPAVILVFIAVPTIQTIFAVDGQAPEDALQVEVVGHQWWWEFRYPELGVVTANEVHVPQGRTVQFVISSADVIHSFWFPKLHGKRDAMPGRTTRLAMMADSVGVFMGQCAEFCGESHANMRMRLVVDAPADFDAWVQRQRTPVATDTTDALLVAGQTAYQQKGCVACHAMDGISAGVIGPNLSHFGSRSTVAAGILPNDAEGLARWLRDPQGEKPGALMPQLPLTDDEVAALVAFLQSKQ